MDELAAQAILTPSTLTRVIERWPAAARSNVHRWRPEPESAVALRYPSLIRRIANRICRLVGGIG